MPDPTAAGDLKLDMTYRGGVRVFVNGTEVARGHLPRGEITMDTPGEVYPWEAYVYPYTPVKAGKKPSYFQQRTIATKKEAGLPTLTNERHSQGWFNMPGEVFGEFDQGQKVGNSWAFRHWKNTDLRFGRPGTRGGLFNREEWDYFRKLRDRKLPQVTIPAKLLRKGVNVLAVEVRTSDLNPVTGTGSRPRTWARSSLGGNYTWFHALVMDLKLTAPSGKVPSTTKRPAGVQVWVEDMHRRLMDVEYTLSEKTGTARFTGAPNGTFTSQIVIGTDKALASVKLSPSALKGPGTIPASALRVQGMRARPMWEYKLMTGGARGSAFDYKKAQVATAARLASFRHLPEGLDPAGLSAEEKLKPAMDINFYDNITDEPQSKVRAGRCQAYWLRLRVPADAAPGKYTGSVVVSAEGMKPVTVPVEVEVCAWRIPDPKDFQTVVALEESPYGVAAQYKLKPWSNEHFTRVEQSMRLLGTVGNDWLIVPVIKYTEFGNKEDTVIKWTRKKDGALSFDYTNLDRYIGLATKHWGRPSVIVFVVMHGTGGKNPVTVDVLDEATGKTATISLRNDQPHYRSAWNQFGVSLYSHMVRLGLARSMHWGLAWDSEGDSELPVLMSQATPGVYWASATHGHGAGVRHYYRAKSFIYKLGQLQVHSRMGWKRKDIMVVNARGGGTVTCISGASPGPIWRVMPDRAITAGANGIGRIGVDSWQNTYLAGFRDRGFLPPGLSVVSMFWPSKESVESSQRYEALREGIQETEARIFLEQQLDRKVLPAELDKKVRKVLFEHARETLYLPTGGPTVSICELSPGWQSRSRRLFNAAGEVAGLVSFDVARSVIGEKVPARGQRRALVKLRNWSPKPRAWKASADQPWIVPAQAAGSLQGQQELVVTLDSTKLTAGKKATGTLTITDVESGKAFPISVSADVPKVFSFVPPDANVDRRNHRYIPDEGKVSLNVTVGATKVANVPFVNGSDTEVAWKVESPVAWLKVAPSSGKARPQSPVTLKVTATPPDKTSMNHDLVLKVTEPGGTAAVNVPVIVHVIPPYVKPVLPKGEGLVITGDVAKSLSLNPNRGGWAARPVKKLSECKSSFETGHVRNMMIRKKWYPYAVRTRTPHRATLKLEGSGYKAFSAEVGIPERWYGPYGNVGPDWMRVNFEIFVDGKIRAQSGMMGPKDGARLLVVDELENAKTLTLHCRPFKMPGDWVWVLFGEPKMWK